MQSFLLSQPAETYLHAGLHLRLEQSLLDTVINLCFHLLTLRLFCEQLFTK